MKAVTAWNTEHYAPPGGGNVPYISRLAPGERSVSFEYADPIGSDGLRAVYGRRGEAPLSSVPLSGGSCEICGLGPDTDHEITVVAPDGRRSAVRLARTGYVPGTVVNYLHPDDPARLAVPEIKTFATPRFNHRARYVRVQAVPLATIPTWHRATGNPAWIFTDEIIVN